MNLSDIMQKRCSLDLLNFPGRETEFNSDGPRELTDADGMTRGIGIASFNGLDHDLQKLLTAVLQLMIQSVDVPYGDNRKDDTNQSD